MIKFFFHPTPNPFKVALMLEETGLAYEVMPLDTMRGDQHKPVYRLINPNGKAPAIVDDGTRVFDSNAILLYLAQKSGKFLGQPEDYGELLSWLMFIASGLGPFSGQAVHFSHMHIATTDQSYAAARYLGEAKRHYAVLDQQLATREYIAGDEYTIVDIAAWGWIDRAARVLDEKGLAPYPHLQRWFNQVNARPAVARARNIGQGITFKSDFDEEAKRAFFPHSYPAEK